MILPKIMKFSIKTSYKITPAQKAAVENLAKNYDKNPKQTLLGITGSGKTFVMANLIQKVQKPTLILAHNKTLAAQLYGELKELFPQNRVEYFISYYDYYQPESYLPTTDTYIEKDSSVNEEIERMRLRAVASLLSRNDVIIVASISCIYGLQSPEDFKKMSIDLQTGKKLSRQDLIYKLVSMQYERNDSSPSSGNFRVRGDTVDIIPGYDKKIIRVELFGDEIERISEVHHVTGDTISQIDKIVIFPAKQFAEPEEKIKIAIEQIKKELSEHAPKLDILERERLKKRTNFDLEMLEELGFCSGIENYARHFDGRGPGSRPYVLLDYFPKDFLFIIDESHQTIPQSRAMYNGDYSRKKSLVDYGFRLPCAYDNRPLKFPEFEKFLNHVLFVSATPAEYELKHSKNVVELIQRPTGLLDPEVEIRPIKNQIPNLISEINKSTKNNDRVLVTVLTKKMAEDLTSYLSKEGIKVRYMHSDIDSLDRIELIRQLRLGEFDVLVGINLLREGLDIPEVALIAILDADKEGFLRDERSLIQTIGRAARNENGRVILYADNETKSIKKAMKITKDRRLKQQAYNKEHKITPHTIKKLIPDQKREIKGTKHLAKNDVKKQIVELESQMRKEAENLNFEKAIEIRDTISKLERELNVK